MNKIFIYLKLKDAFLYIFFCYLFIFLMVFSTGIAKAKTYNVEKVEIIEPYDLDFKKEIVIDKAFKSAFEILISRIINSDNIKSVDFNNINEIRTMVDSFLIQNEKFIDNWNETFDRAYGV